MAYSVDTDSDKAWEGLIYYKHKGTFVARYECYWGVVRRESSRGLQRIDLFRPQSAVHSTSDLFIPLHDVLHVLNREARARRFAFQILATGSKYHLAAESGEERQRWVQRLEGLLFGPSQPGIIYEHQVHVIPNSHSERLQLSGRYTLRITNSHIALFTSTGTLPTRFLYSLADIARTRYTNFTNAGHKFSVLVLYCQSDDADDVDVNGAESGSQRYATIRRGSHGNVPAGGNEDMFVFQTQSASTASRVIDHRAKDVARREGHTHKSTPPSETLNHTLPRSPSPIASSLLPLITSLPTYATTTLLNDREPPHLSDNHLVKAPPPPKPVTETEGVQGNVSTNGMLRRDEEKLASAMQSSDVTGCVQDMTSPTFRAQSLQHRMAVSVVQPAPKKKVPIPLPRKKYSFDSATYHNKPRHSDVAGHTPTVKLRPVPPPKPKFISAARMSHSESDSAIKVHDSAAANVESPVAASTPLPERGRPTYANLAPVTAGEGEAEEGVGQGEGGAQSAYVNLSPVEAGEGEGNKEGGEEEGKGKGEEKEVGEGVGEEVGEGDGGEEKGRTSSEVSRKERYYNLPPLSLGKAVAAKVLASEVCDTPSPTLDEFLARILQRRRESKDSGTVWEEEEEEEEEKGRGGSPLRQAVGRLRSSDSKFRKSLERRRAVKGTRARMNGDGDSASGKFPEYYNLLPLREGGGEQKWEGGGVKGEEKGAGGWEAEEDELISGDFGGGEKEYPSEWLRRDDEEGKGEGEEGKGEGEEGKGEEEVGRRRKEGDDESVVSSEVDKVQNTYIEILPYSPTRPVPPPKPSARPSSRTSSVSPTTNSTAHNEISETLPTEPQLLVTALPLGRDSPSTPDSGSPLWGTRRPWSRQSSSRSSAGARQDWGKCPLPSDPGGATSPPIPRRRQGSKVYPLFMRSSRSGDLSQYSVGRQRAGSREGAMFQFLMGSQGRRGSNRGSFLPKPLTSPLPLPLPDRADSDSGEELEVDSDYEWAEVGDPPSDADSDFTYTRPWDFEPLESTLVRSLSCSELRDTPMDEGQPFSISDRPPAPLPSASLPTPVDDEVMRKRSTFQRSRSLDQWNNSCIYEELEGEGDYDYVYDPQKIESDYDYASIPNRSAATLYRGASGEYVDINRNSSISSLPPRPPSGPRVITPSPSLPSPRSPPLLPPRPPPLPPPRPLASLPVTDV